MEACRKNVDTQFDFATYLGHALQEVRELRQQGIEPVSETLTHARATALLTMCYAVCAVLLI